MRRRIFFAYEAAEREADPERRRAWLTFVIVGAGPTGVELAGALAEIAHHGLAGDFRRIDPAQAPSAAPSAAASAPGAEPESAPSGAAIER